MALCPGCRRDSRHVVKGHVWPYCKKCQSEKTRGWRSTHPNKLHQSNLPTVRRERHLRETYGITLDDYDRLVRQQGGLCAICKRERTLVVDHDHVTLKVRGLLCHYCNRGLGMFGDSLEGLQRAVDYLKASV